ncbi:rhomboid family intramembrane serine protease [Rubrimonas cliftonensis]|uniref:Rhomboid family protein n=1 Tax=Rubrimonas cliftonensis TaxID=89524 RepID=A0A1H3WTD3_9RHOB|nr:rhomboid family intramembrane serine protease [Rubrimonas cliftonensis]SDZ89624.1 Rhomboid family protein [Rubrimonas cliftonensis]
MRTGAPPIVWAMAAVFVVLETTLTLSDIGVLPRGLRWTVYRYVAFYDIYFEAWRSGQNVPLAFYWSFVSHAFFHGGMLHLAMNTGVFLALGTHLCRAVGERAMLALFLGAAVVGALFFGLVADTGLEFVPMVGASGGLFGFLGAMKRWEWRHVVAHALPRRRFWSTILALTAVNVLLSVSLTGGGVAWEAHLGGFIGGWLAGGLLTPRRGFAIGPI